MALSKPILNPIGAWDVAVGTTFTFNVIGGDQVEGNRLTICEQDDLENSVYQEAVASYDYSHTVSANAPNLANGTYYVAYVQTYRTVGGVATYSAQSNTIQFRCYTTPEFNLTNFSAIIPSSEFTFEAVYHQDEGEDLSTYKFNLYNTQGALIKTSGLLYGSDLTPRYEIDDGWYYDISYTVQGLENLGGYYIEMVGTTSGNTQLTTGRQYFVVNYQGEIESVLIKAINQCADGNILVTSFLDVMNGESISEPVYVDDKEIDLRGIGRLPNTVTWDELDDQTDLSIRLVFRAPITLGGSTANVLLMEFQDEDDIGGLYYSYDETTQKSLCRFYPQGATAIETSTFVGIPNDHIKYVLVLKRASGVWSIEWSVYDYPSGTLYTEGNNAYVSVLEVNGTEFTPNTQYTYFGDDESINALLYATTSDDYDYDFNYNTKNGNINLTT